MYEIKYKKYWIDSFKIVVDKVVIIIVGFLDLIEYIDDHDIVVVVNDFYKEIFH